MNVEWCRRSDVRCARVRWCSPLIDQRRLNGIDCTLVMRGISLKPPLHRIARVRGGTGRCQIDPVATDRPRCCTVDVAPVGVRVGIMDRNTG